MKQTFNSRVSRSLHRIAVVSAAGLIALAAASVVAPGASADNGNATSGTTSASNDSIVIQRNIQVIAGPGSQDNSTQTAENNAHIQQIAAAESGDANASGGGSAMSGNASASNFAVVHQMNIQVIAGVNCSATQIASNDATIGQAAVAQSGSATANGPGGTARSGNASASNVAVVNQMNRQIHVCTGKGSGQPGYQEARNSAQVEQIAIAQSGDATANGGGRASSGDATARNYARFDQRNYQRSFN